MPALAKSPARLPRFVPHGNTQVICAEASAGAGDFSLSNQRSTQLSTHLSGNGTQSEKTKQPIAWPAEAAADSRRSEGSESMDRLAHDARNVVSALKLYCELLSTPGVLSRKHGHRAQELEVIALSAAQIIERMAQAKIVELAAEQALPHKSVSPLPATTSITDAAEELRRLQPLLTAVAGPGISLSIAAMPCSGTIALTVEALTRILVNLVRNAVDAMPSRGHIRITAQYGDGLSFADLIDICPEQPRSILLSVVDDGPGIPEAMRERIFEPGFTTHKQNNDWPSPRHHGLGLSIVRDLVEEAGGVVRATTNPVRGTRFDIALPLLEPISSGMYSTSLNSAFPTEGRAKGCLECH